MRRNALFLIIVLALCSILGAGAASAQEAPAGELPAPTDFVRAKADQLLDIMNREVVRGTDAFRQRQEDLKAAVRGFINFEELCRRALGDHWDARTEEERARFVELMTRLIETNYTVKLSDRTIGTNHGVTYTDELRRNEYAMVSGTGSSTERTVQFQILMLQRDGHWIIYDVVTDDVSILETYAESFDEIIRDEGWDALIQRLLDRTAELERELAEQAAGE
jgi:phospholipid transport system substrate-binding protein